MRGGSRERYSDFVKVNSLPPHRTGWLYSYCVSHDLRAPLRKIDGFSNILLEDAESLSSNLRKCQQQVRIGTNHISQFVNCLLNFSRLGRLELIRHEVNLKALTDFTISEIERETGPRPIQWRVGDLPNVDCDSSPMRQAFRNLMSNAVKFTRTRNPAVIESGTELESRDWCYSSARMEQVSTCAPPTSLFRSSNASICKIGSRVGVALFISFLRAARKMDEWSAP